MKEKSKRVVLAFASEAEEAAWWYENSKSHDKEFAVAAENGEAQVLTGQKLGADRSIQSHNSRTSDFASGSGSGLGDGPEAGRARGPSLPDLHSSRYCTKRLPSAKKRDEWRSVCSPEASVTLWWRRYKSTIPELSLSHR
jgi:hypothetical protein